MYSKLATGTICIPEYTHLKRHNEYKQSESGQRRRPKLDEQDDQADGGLNWCSPGRVLSELVDKYTNNVALFNNSQTTEHTRLCG